MRLLYSVLLLVCLTAPVRAAWAPVVHATVSESQLAPGMLFELRITVEGVASSVALQLPPEIQHVERPAIEPGLITVPLAVKEDAPAGAYTIRATVNVSRTDVLVSARVTVGSAPPELLPLPEPGMRLYLPFIRR